MFGAVMFAEIKDTYTFHTVQYQVIFILMANQ